jgi:hypothetical protein
MRRLVIVVTLIFAAILALDLYPGLRGGAGWQWPYAAPRDLLPVVVLALGLAVYLGVSLALRRTSVRGLLAWAVIGGTLLAYLLVGVQGDPYYLLFTRTVSPVQTGASALQARIMSTEGVLSTLQRWPQVMDEALGQNLIHFTTSPPGQVLLHQAAADLFDSPALSGFSSAISRPLRAFQCTDVDVMRYTNGEIVSAGLFAYLMPLFAALTAVPLYLIARDLTGDRFRAASLAAWWPLIPAALLFAPTWNTFYPLLCTLAFWLLLRGLNSRRLIWAAASGLVMFAATFLNFSVLPFFLLAGLFTLGWHFVGPRAEGRWLVNPPLTQANQVPLAPRSLGEGDLGGEGPNRLKPIAYSLLFGVSFALGLFLPWLIYALITGVSPLEILGKTFGAHGELVQREYLPWLILHPYDVLLFTGIPAALLAIWGVVRVIRSRRLDSVGLFTLSMALTVLLVNFAGIVQGENARILIFYMPFLLLMTLAVRRDEPRADAPLFAAQAVIVLVMAAVLPVVPLDMDPVPSGPRSDIGSLGDVPWTADGTSFDSSVYAGQFTLDRYRWVGDPARQAITFEFEFGGMEPSERPYQFELVARADTDMGEIVSEPFRWWSQGEEYPPSCWREGEIIRDTVVMPLPPVPHPVEWDVILRAVDERTGDVMLTSTGDAHQLVPIPYP